MIYLLARGVYLQLNAKKYPTAIVNIPVFEESICGTELEYCNKYVHFIPEAFRQTLIRRIRRNEKEIRVILLLLYMEKEKVALITHLA